MSAAMGGDQPGRKGQAKPDPDLPDPKRMDRARAKAGALVAVLIREAQREYEDAQKRKYSEAAKGDREDTGEGPDFGPSLAQRRGLVEVQKDALIPEDPSDPRSNAVRGSRAQRVWAPDRLVRTGRIEQHQHEAAMRFYDDWVLGELGVTPGERPLFGLRSDPWNHLPFSLRRAMRRQSFRFALRAVSSPNLCSVLVWAVLQETGDPSIPPTLEAYAEQRRPKRWPTDMATGLLVAALDVLALHYGYMPVDGVSSDKGR